MAAYYILLFVVQGDDGKYLAAQSPITFAQVVLQASFLKARLQNAHPSCGRVAGAKYKDRLAHRWSVEPSPVTLFSFHIRCKPNQLDET